MSSISYQSPIYLQLREVVRGRLILVSIFRHGDPSENELAETYKINRLTVRNAIDVLVHEGLLKRVQGKGVFVVGAKLERDLETLGGFTQTMRKKSTNPHTKVLIKAQRKAGTKYSRIFNIAPDDDVYYIKRICYADEAPFSLEEIFVPHYILPRLEGISLSVFSLYEVYDFYSIQLKRAWQTLDLAYLEPRDARSLNIDKDMAVFLFECKSYDQNDRVIEFARTYTRSDKCVFRVGFTR